MQKKIRQKKTWLDGWSNQVYLRLWVDSATVERDNHRRALIRNSLTTSPHRVGSRDYAEVRCHPTATYSSFAVVITVVDVEVLCGLLSVSILSPG